MGTKCILASNKPILTTFETYPPPQSYNSALGNFPQGTTQQATHDQGNKTDKLKHKVCLFSLFITLIMC